MQYSKIILSAGTLMLAVSGAVLSTAAQKAPPAVPEPLAVILYRPVDCEPFSCGQVGSISCNLYNLTPPTGPQKTDCANQWANSFAHP